MMIVICGAGEQGEIVVRGALVMSGYFGLPADSAATFRNGSPASGDIGRFDDQGRLYITDHRDIDDHQRWREHILRRSGAGVGRAPGRSGSAGSGRPGQPVGCNAGGRGGTSARPLPECRRAAGARGSSSLLTRCRTLSISAPRPFRVPTPTRSTRIDVTREILAEHAAT